jgi:hypothetical protein
MSEVAEYSVREHLRDDRPITIRALRPDDRAGMLVAIERTSMPSLRYRDESDAPSGGELVAEVLRANTAMLKLFKKFG